MNNDMPMPFRSISPQLEEGVSPIMKRRIEEQMQMSQFKDYEKLVKQSQTNLAEKM